MAAAGAAGCVMLTRPLSTMSLCRSLEDSTSTLIASIRSVQEPSILQRAPETQQGKSEEQTRGKEETAAEKGKEDRRKGRRRRRGEEKKKKKRKNIQIQIQIQIQKKKQRKKKTEERKVCQRDKESEKERRQHSFKHNAPSQAKEWSEVFRWGCLAGWLPGWLAGWPRLPAILYSVHLVLFSH